MTKRIKSFHVLLNYDLWKEAKIMAIKTDKSMSEFVFNALKREIEQTRNQGGEKK